MKASTLIAYLAAFLLVACPVGAGSGEDECRDDAACAPEADLPPGVDLGLECPRDLVGETTHDGSPTKDAPRSPRGAIEEFFQYKPDPPRRFVMVERREHRARFIWRDDDGNVVGSATVAESRGRWMVESDSRCA